MIGASRCPRCQRVAAPSEDRCLACRADTEAVELPGEGRVLTYTDQDGYVALVELEGRARVLARLDEEPAIGETVPLEPARLVTGRL